MRHMFRVRKFWNRWTGLAALCALFLILAGVLGHYSHTKHLRAPATSFSALIATLDQVYITAGSLQRLDGSLPTSPQSVISLRASLTQSLDSSAKLTQLHESDLSKPLQNKLQVLNGQFKQLVQELDTRSNALSKPLNYNPSLDMEALDINQKAPEISARAKAAHDNLDKIAETRTFALHPDQNQQASLGLQSSGSFTLFDATYNALKDSAICFGQLADDINQNNLVRAVQTRSRCVENYGLVRKEIVKEIVEPFNSKIAQDDLSNLYTVLKELKE